MEIGKKVFSFFFSDVDFFDNKVFEEQFQKNKNFLPFEFQVFINKVLSDSSQSKLKFEKTTLKYQKNLKKCKMPITLSSLDSMGSHGLEYSNKQICDKIEELSQSLPFFRKIRGDGNCFYRAIGFAFLEQSLYRVWTCLKKKKFEETELMNFLQDLHNKKIVLLKCVMSKSSNDKGFQIMGTFLEKVELILYVFLRECCKIIMFCCEATDFKDVVSRLEENFVENLIFDLSVVVIMRSYLHNTLKNNLTREEYVPFMVFPEEFLTSLTIFGEEAENIIIPLTSDALRRNIIIYMIHKDQKTGVPSILKQTYEPLIKKKEDEERMETISLYFRPGHYDLGYENK